MRTSVSPDCGCTVSFDCFAFFGVWCSSSPPCFFFFFPFFFFIFVFSFSSSFCSFICSFSFSFSFPFSFSFFFATLFASFPFLPFDCFALFVFKASASSPRFSFLFSLLLFFTSCSLSWARFDGFPIAARRKKTRDQQPQPKQECDSSMCRCVVASSPLAFLGQPHLPFSLVNKQASHGKPRCWHCGVDVTLFALQCHAISKMSFILNTERPSSSQETRCSTGRRRSSAAFPLPLPLPSLPHPATRRHTTKKKKSAPP